MAETEPETLTETLNGENKQNSTSSDSSDTDDDLLDDDDDLHLETLQKALADNPCDYDAHSKHITCLRKLGRIDQLRQAREAMSDLFPLSPTMWQQWAKDEASLSSSSETFDAIIKLYERGVHDYLSVSLWCDYINFVQENVPLLSECSSVGISTIRDLFERAVTAVGLHVTEGSRIWNAYINFEQSVLHTIDDGHTEEKEKQVQRIRSIFHRKLSVPLSDSKSTLLAYKSWEAEQGGMSKATSNDSDGIPSHVSIAYEKAMEMHSARAHYEEQILKQAAPAEKLQYFMTYLKFEQSFGDPARVQILYERAITEFPVSSELWLDYVRYLDETLKVGKSILDVYSRATRNCTWIGELWVRNLLSLERAHSSEEKLSNVFEKSLQCVFSSPEEYLDIFLTRIDGLRRKICTASSSVDSLDYSVVRETFQRATDYLSPYLKNTDGLLRLHAYWARLELNHGKDLVAVRGVWESLLKTSGSMLEAWNQYVAMEIQMGHIDEARRIYKRCYTKRFAGTGSEDICHSWVRFEREFGTLEDYDHAVRKVTPRLEELKLFHLQQQSKSDITSVAQKNDTVPKKTPQKRKMGAKSTDEQPRSKKQRDTAQDTKSFGNEASQTREENNMGSGEPKVDKLDTMNEQRKLHSASKEGYTDQCTVFLSNLSFQAKDETLREFFSDVGGVTDIRLLRDKFTGKSRGLAYVDFKDDVHLAAALKKNKQILMGKKVSIAKSDPKNKRKDSSGSGKSNREHDKRGAATDIGGSGEGFVSQEGGSVASNTSSSTSKRPGKEVQLKGKNTFAVPRSLVKPLGWSQSVQKEKDKEDTLKSNDEFRELMLKK